MKANFKIVRTNKTEMFLGGKCNLYVAMTNDGKFGYLPNETTPYMPIGGIKTLMLVKDILIFR